MKTLVRSLGITAILLGAAPALAGQTQSPADGVNGDQSFSVPAISKDDDDNTVDDDEGTGVVDPVPQDDGSPGVDDPSTC